MVTLLVIVGVVLLPVVGSCSLWVGLRNGDRAGDIKVALPGRGLTAPPSSGPVIGLRNPSRRPVIVTVEARPVSRFRGFLVGGGVARTQYARPAGASSGEVWVVEACGTLAITLPDQPSSTSDRPLLVTVRLHQAVGRLRVHRRVLWRTGVTGTTSGA